MKTEIREIITDIKAAALIGLEESLWLSLESLLELPQISGNAKMEEAFIRQAIVPIGEVLAGSKLSLQQLQPIGKTSYAAYRSISAVALTIRLFTKDEGSLSDLDSFANDPRYDVRLSLSIAVEKYGIYNPRKLVQITEHFFITNSPRSLSVAIQLIPALLEVHPEKAFEYLSRIPFSNDNDLRMAFSNALSHIAISGFEEKVLEFMDELISRKEDYLWVISKSLSGAWATKQIKRTLDLLEKLTISFGPHKLISNTFKALIRHGAGDEVEKKLAEWAHGTEENLLLAAKQFINI